MVAYSFLAPAKQGDSVLAWFLVFATDRAAKVAIWSEDARRAHFEAVLDC